VLSTHLDTVICAANGATFLFLLALFLIWFFIALCFSPPFSLLFCSFFFAHVVSSLALPQLA
jgi:hypothetical protein